MNLQGAKVKKILIYSKQKHIKSFFNNLCTNSVK